MTHPIPDDLEDISTAAMIAHLKPNTVRKLIKSGRLSVYGNPHNYLVSLSELIPVKAATISRINTKPRSYEHLKPYQFRKDHNSWLARRAKKSQREGKETTAPAIVENRTAGTEKTASVQC